MNNKYKNSYIVKEKELVSLSVYNVGFQSCDSLYQWGPGIRDHYLIHYIISGKGRYTVNGSVHTLTPGDAFLVYPNTEVIYQAVLSHHERYDGKGYPRGLKGEDIPLLGRILAVCDSFDAMTTKRTYKEAMSIDYAISELEHNKGTQFDPKLAEAFIELLKEGKIEV